jgi:PKD repeat protein
LYTRFKIPIAVYVRAIVTLAFYCLIGSTSVYAQAPANDDCANAEVLTVTNSGYGLSTIVSSKVDISKATAQANENFHSLIVNSGNNTKSVWFKFTIPVARAIKLELKQVGNNIGQSEAGFTTFFSSNCFPALSEVDSSNLTPLDKFGSTSTSCGYPGTYMIQVSARAAAKGQIYIEVTLDKPAVFNAFDFMADAYSFGTLAANVPATASNVIGCLSLEAAAEMCSALGSDKDKFTQSCWYTFTTPAYFDFIRLEPAWTSNNNIDNRIVYRLYEGNAKSSTIGSLSLVSGCDIISSGSKQFDYLCNLKPSTTYSVQLMFYRYENGTVKLDISTLGKAASAAPIPLSGSVPSSNKLGVVTGSQSKTSTLTDYFGCNARLSLSANTCGAVNQLNGFSAPTGETLNLCTWYSFELGQDALVEFHHDLKQRPCDKVYVRIFRKDFGTTCGSGPVLSDITSQFWNSNKVPCMKKGLYTVQILGTLSADPVSCYDALGDEISVSIKTVPVAVNDFGLTVSGEIDLINSFNPISYSGTYLSKKGAFDCNENVLPIPSTCQTGTSKSIYRKFKVADGDNDGINDSMYVSVYRQSLGTGFYDPFQVFKGDANAEAVAQNKFSGGQDLGMASLEKCFNGSDTCRLCLTTGTYTVSTFGESSNINDSDKIGINVNKRLRSKYNNPATPDITWGDITNKKTEFFHYSDIDTVSCQDNPVVIDGQEPCDSATKLFYRVFSLTKPMVIRISHEKEPGHKVKLYTGDCRNGLGSLTYYKDSIGKWGCDTPIKVHYCYPLPAGTYTLVSYLTGKSYNRNQITGINRVNTPTSLYLYIYEIPKPPKYNRPYKADIRNLTTKPIDLQVPNGFVDDISQSFPLDTEYFNCTEDVPYSIHPTPWFCDSKMNRTAYFVFRLKQESFLTVRNVDPLQRVFPTYLRCYPFDVRIDSAKMATDSALQPCVEADFNMQICKMQAGVYSLVFTVGDTLIGDSLMYSIYASTVPTARHDHAYNAYDFGAIPGTGQQLFGKLGEVNSFGHKPSFDLFSCTTGSQTTDPDGGLCSGTNDNTVKYPPSANQVLYKTTPTQKYTTRRNLWYTFSIKGAGRISIQVNEKYDPARSGFGKIVHIYKSIQDGNVDFATLMSTGKIDSTLSQGLTEVTNNICGSGCTACDLLSFDINPCDTFTAYRYYLVVDQAVSQLYPNDWVEIGIKFDSINPSLPYYDFYVNTNVISSKPSLFPPYKNEVLYNGVYEGYIASIDCATLAPTDQNDCGSKTIWYRFDLGAGRKLRWQMDTISIDTADKGAVAWPDDMVLFREKVAGDSTINGLEKVTDFQMEDINGSPWMKTCGVPGRYYIMITGCNHIFLRRYRPRIFLESDVGDFCDAPVTATFNGVGSMSTSVDVTCHSSGESYGEDGSNMGCLFPIDSGFKTSWFRIDLSSANKVDVNFEVVNNTNAPAPKIRYRILYGSCDAMTPGPCNVSSFTKFTLNCLESGTYYIQVQSPAYAKGSVEVKLTATPTSDPNCEPIRPELPVADFELQANCNQQPVKFWNHSTAGALMKYNWDFGYNNLKDTIKNPSIYYPITNKIDTYYVTLKVTNIKSKRDSTIIKRIILHPIPKAKFNADVTCGQLEIHFIDSSKAPATGESITYNWDFGDGTFSNDTNPIHTYSQYGVKNVVLAVVSSEGCSDTARKQLYLKPAPHAHFNAKEVCLGDTIHFMDSSYSDIGTIIKWTWTFGNGQSTSITNKANGNIDHLYTKAGKYPVSLAVLSDSGCSDTLVKDITIHAYPVEQFWVDTPVCANTLVQFSDSSFIETTEDTINQSYWEFGDGRKAYIQHPTHTYLKEGLYTVFHRVSSSGGCTSENKYTDRVIVHPSPKALFTLRPDSVSFFFPTITFTNLSQGAIAYMWDFANGDISTLENPVYDYTDTGHYRVKLTAFNIFGCKDSTYHQVYIAPDFTFFMPDVLTPNKKGPLANETFGPVGIFKGIKEFEMHIYNRWGEEVFFSNDIYHRWDGTFHDKICQDELYIYLVRYRDFFRNEYHQEGRVLLYR